MPALSHAPALVPASSRTRQLSHAPALRHHRAECPCSSACSCSSGARAPRVLVLIGCACSSSCSCSSGARARPRARARRVLVLVECSCSLGARARRVSHAGGPHVASFVRRSSVHARASVRACERAWRAAQCAASRKKERSAKKRVGTLNRKKALCVLRGHRGRWERRVRSCIKERGAVCVLWCKEDRGQRER